MWHEAIPRTSDVPHHSLFFEVSLYFLQRRAKPAMRDVPSNLIFTIPVQKIGFDGQNVLQQCIFPCQCFFFFFAMRTAKPDVHGVVFAIVKQACLFLQCFESVHYQCNFYTAIAIFALPEKYVLQFEVKF